MTNYFNLQKIEEKGRNIQTNKEIDDFWMKHEAESKTMPIMNLSKRKTMCISEEEENYVDTLLQFSNLNLIDEEDYIPTKIKRK